MAQLRCYQFGSLRMTRRICEVGVTHFIFHSHSLGRQLSVSLYSITDVVRICDNYVGYILFEKLFCHTFLLLIKFFKITMDRKFDFDNIGCLPGITNANQLLAFFEDQLDYLSLCPKIPDFIYIQQSPLTNINKEILRKILSEKKIQHSPIHEKHFQSRERQRQRSHPRETPTVA